MYTNTEPTFVLFSVAKLGANPVRKNSCSRPKIVEYSRCRAVLIGGQWYNVAGGKECSDHVFFHRPQTSDELVIPVDKIEALKISQPPIDDARPARYKVWAE